MKTAEAREVHIGKVVRNAILFNFGPGRGGTVRGDDLMEAVSRLFELLREKKIEYLLVGGIAILKYVEGRNTEDIDLIMALSSLEKLPELRVEDRDDDFVRASFDGLRIDLLLTSNPLFEKVRSLYATTQRFTEQDIPCATVEGLLILKLYALPSLYRQGNFARVALYESDISTLMHDYRPPIEPLFEELRPHLSATDLASVRKIVEEIQERIERFDRRA
jgi:predicted nucleotidyltransferase